MTWLDDARNVTLETAAMGLGISVSRHGGPCPLCGHEDACKAQAGGRWWCFSGVHGGDVVDLVSAVLVGEVYKRPHIDAVRGWFASQGWCDSYGDAAPAVPRRAPPPRPVEAEPTYPPAEEVAAFLRQCIPCSDADDVVDWMVQRRGLGVDAPRRLAVVGVLALSRRAECPTWAHLGKRTWTDLGYRVVVPMYDHTGAARSVRARCVGDPPWDGAPKALPPRDHSQRGLVMANRPGVRMLLGIASPVEVVVVEGEPQWMAACLRWPSRAVLGIVSGSWTAELAARVPMGAEVLVVTDHDSAGEKYAVKVAETLEGRAVRRHEGVVA